MAQSRALRAKDLYFSPAQTTSVRSSSFSSRSSGAISRRGTLPCTIPAPHSKPRKLPSAMRTL